jgi:hypothetical protein
MQPLASTSSTSDGNPVPENFSDQVKAWAIHEMDVYVRRMIESIIHMLRSEFVDKPADHIISIATSNLATRVMAYIQRPRGPLDTDENWLSDISSSFDGLTMTYVHVWWGNIMVITRLLKYNITGTVSEDGTFTRASGHIPPIGSTLIGPASIHDTRTRFTVKEINGNTFTVNEPYHHDPDPDQEQFIFKADLNEPTYDLFMQRHRIKPTYFDQRPANESQRWFCQRLVLIASILLIDHIAVKNPTGFGTVMLIPNLALVNYPALIDRILRRIQRFNFQFSPDPTISLNYLQIQREGIVLTHIFAKPAAPTDAPTDAPAAPTAAPAHVAAAAAPVAEQVIANPSVQRRITRSMARKATQHDAPF